MTHWFDWMAMAGLSAVLIAAATWDWRTGRVPNRLTYPAVLLGLAWAAAAGAMGSGVGGMGGAVGAWAGLMSGLIGCAAGLIPFYVLFAAGGLGGGDAKLMAAVGAISASWRCVLATAVYAFVIGFILAVVIMIHSGLVRRTLSRLLGAALMSSARVQPDLPDDSPRVPFALAIALGGLVAGAEVLLDVPTPWAAF